MALCVLSLVANSPEGRRTVGDIVMDACRAPAAGYRITEQARRKAETAAALEQHVMEQRP